MGSEEGSEEGSEDRGAGDAQALAEFVREGMLRNDHATRALGMDIESIGPGSARIRMRVRRDMLNGFATCHGGFITCLADSAFAFACNSRNACTVASGISVDFLRPAMEGDELIAHASEVSRSARTGLYDVTVTNQRGEAVAVLRGRSFELKGRSSVPAEPAGALRSGAGDIASASSRE